MRPARGHGVVTFRGVTLVLAGVGPDAAKDFSVTRMPPGVEPYDETITSERIIAVGDMYYLWQHEKIGAGIELL